MFGLVRTLANRAIGPEPALALNAYNARATASAESWPVVMMTDADDAVQWALGPASVRRMVPGSGACRDGAPILEAGLASSG
jgi:hypothetical protein